VCRHTTGASTLIEHDHPLPVLGKVPCAGEASRTCADDGGRSDCGMRPDGAVDLRCSICSPDRGKLDVAYTHRPLVIHARAVFLADMVAEYSCDGGKRIVRKYDGKAMIGVARTRRLDVGRHFLVYGACFYTGCGETVEER